jgi:RNA polymerase sigma factor (sigma-70 family)
MAEDKFFLKNADIDQLHASVFKYHFDTLYSYGLKISKNDELVKDCIQELFYRIWKNNIDFSSITYIKAYLLKGLRRQILNVLALKYNNIDKVEIEENISVEFSPEDYYIINQQEQETKNKVLNALNQLSKKQREAIYLRYFEELEYDEIADIMNINLQSVKNNVQRGLAALKGLLDVALLITLFRKDFFNFY